MGLRAGDYAPGEDDERHGKDAGSGAFDHLNNNATLIERDWLFSADQVIQKRMQIIS